MNRFTWTIASVLLSASAGFSKSPCDRTIPLTDQENWIRSEIQAKIDESIEAAEAKDLPAMMHSFART